MSNITSVIYYGWLDLNELHIVSLCLNGLSTLALALMILSYGCLRKTRKGVPAKLTLSLCCALTLLYCVQFLYEADAITGHVVGCRILNSLRNYFVLVALLFNGIGGVNMYMMLVKVFDTGISSFVLAGSIVAWVSPALLITLVLLINETLYDGLIRDGEVASCVLSKNLLYFGTLLPISLIIGFNTIIFTLVLINIRRRRSNIPTPTTMAPNNRGLTLKVYGLIGVMCTLGFPWIFALISIATSHPENNKFVQNLFQALFIVIFGLQGIVLFIIHVISSKETRDSWLKLLRDCGGQVANNELCKCQCYRLKTTKITTTIVTLNLQQMSPS